MEVAGEIISGLLHKRARHRRKWLILSLLVDRPWALRRIEIDRSTKLLRYFDGSVYRGEISLHGLVARELVYPTTSLLAREHCFGLYNSLGYEMIVFSAENPQVQRDFMEAINELTGNWPLDAAPLDASDMLNSGFNEHADTGTPPIRRGSSRSPGESSSRSTRKSVLSTTSLNSFSISGIPVGVLVQLHDILAEGSCNLTSYEVLLGLVLPLTQREQSSVVELIQRKVSKGENEWVVDLSGVVDEAKVTLSGVGKRAESCGVREGKSGELPRKPVQVFVCHHWQDSFLGTVQAVLQFLVDSYGEPCLRDRNVTVWMDIFCVNYHQALSGTHSHHSNSQTSVNPTKPFRPDSSTSDTYRLTVVLTTITHFCVCMPASIEFRRASSNSSSSSGSSSSSNGGNVSGSNRELNTGLFSNDACLWELFHMYQLNPMAVEIVWANESFPGYLNFRKLFQRKLDKQSRIRYLQEFIAPVGIGMQSIQSIRNSRAFQEIKTKARIDAVTFLQYLSHLLLLSFYTIICTSKYGLYSSAPDEENSCDCKSQERIIARRKQYLAKRRRTSWRAEDSPMPSSLDWSKLGFHAVYQSLSGRHGLWLCSLLLQGGFGWEALQLAYHQMELLLSRISPVDGRNDDLTALSNDEDSRAEEEEEDEELERWFRQSNSILSVSAICANNFPFEAIRSALSQQLKIITSNMETNELKKNATESLLLLAQNCQCIGSSLHSALFGMDIITRSSGRPVTLNENSSSRRTLERIARFCYSVAVHGYYGSWSERTPNRTAALAATIDLLQFELLSRGQPLTPLDNAAVQCQELLAAISKQEEMQSAEMSAFFDQRRNQLNSIVAVLRFARGDLTEAAELVRSVRVDAFVSSEEPPAQFNADSSAYNWKLEVLRENNNLVISCDELNVNRLNGGQLAQVKSDASLLFGNLDAQLYPDLCELLSSNLKMALPIL